MCLRTKTFEEAVILTKLILIAGVQLCPAISSLNGVNKKFDVALMCDVMAEAANVSCVSVAGSNRIAMPRETLVLT